MTLESLEMRRDARSLAEAVNVVKKHGEAGQGLRCADRTTLIASILEFLQCRHVVRDGVKRLGEEQGESFVENVAWISCS